MPSGARTGSATSTWSMSTSDTCGASSATTRRRRGSSARCAASGTGWAGADGPDLAQPGRTAVTAQALVVLAGAVTLAVVATAVGPSIFHAHLAESAHGVDPQTSSHVEQAYRSANAISLSVALLAALAAALTVSAYLARRLGRTVAALAHAAARIADGQYGTHVPAPGLGTDFDTLTAAFNAMAARLQAVEATRRQLLADLGHEMRTPLSTIEGYLDAAEDGISVPDEDTTTVLRTQTARLRRLAEDLTAVTNAAEHRLHRGPVAPADVVRTALAAARTAYAAKGVDLREQTDTQLPAVPADAGRLGQVLGNLLDNALRHTPPGGQVAVRTRGAPGRVEIAVCDTGTGIAPAHGGQVTAESPGPGRGATFTITLPAA